MQVSAQSTETCNATYYSCTDSNKCCTYTVATGIYSCDKQTPCTACISPDCIKGKSLNKITVIRIFL